MSKNAKELIGYTAIGVLHLVSFLYNVMFYVVDSQSSA